ncbi:hypothetical protein [Gordonia sihwensis]|uniref:hypothetical protein n=1 Tax=Gordonia sihwensis TaxID=173559 RepID=UPI00061FF016|nr:hypothetical protein [Gordonia sihwensis]KJR05084.1 integral membrane protein [Gordonia sihwensis]
MTASTLDHPRYDFRTASAVPAPRARLASLVIGTSAAATAALLWLVQIVLVDVAARGHGSDLREALTQWDAQWMTLIADHGYGGFAYTSDPAEPTILRSVAFFPGYPTVVRAVAAPLTIFGVDDATLIAAVVTSAAASLALAWGSAVLALEIWTRAVGHEAGLAASVAVSVVATAVVFGAPMSVVYWMPYSESLFTALAVWALVAMVRGRFGVAGVLVLAAGLTRLTGAALVATLAVAAAVELIDYSRRRGTLTPRPFPCAAAAAPVVGSLGIAGYLAWASDQTRSAGGYFAIQDRGWGSGWDWGQSTIGWISDHAVGGLSDTTQTGYTISAWSMIAAAALCVVTLWPVVRGHLPWQPWVFAVGVAVIVLGSGGIMHSRPRLLLIPISLIALGLAVLAISAAARTTGWRRWIIAAAIMAGIVAWCALGIQVSVTMLVDFDYGI